MKKVLVIFGTRPEAIKMAPVVLELRTRAALETLVCVTAQHREMLDSVLETFSILPDYDLGIMRQQQTLSHITTTALTGLETVMQQTEPDLVLVHGDTTTTFAAALAAYYCQIPVGHVEAGLRTWNRLSPYPEEMNRQMTDCIAQLLFAPTEQSRQNLLRENRTEAQIIVTGNTAIDALKTTVRADYTHPLLDELRGHRLLLLTAHRRENLGEPLRRIFRAVRRICEEFPDVRVVYPLHMNPVVRDIAEEELAGCQSVHLIEPLEVLDFHNFLAASTFVLSDSGGIQEEAPSLGKPVLVLRDTTERPEGLACNTLKLAGTDEDTIYRLTRELLTDRALYDSMSRAQNPYGDGFAAVRIADAIESFLT